MKSPRDTGYSPNQRFDRDPKANAIHLTSGETIRIVTNYNKVIGVRHTMIRIQDLANDDPTGRMFYTIPDEKLAYMLTRTGVRVRMVKEDPSYIYLFEPRTDTYLGCVARDLETAGDEANATEEDKKRRGEFSKWKQRLTKYRKDALQEVEDGIMQENEKHEKEVLPASLSASHGVVIPAERRKVQNESTPEDGVGEVSPSDNPSPQMTQPSSRKQPEDLEEVETMEVDLNFDELERELKDDLETV